MIPPPAAFRRLAVATAVLTYLLIIMGGIVRVTGSGLGCGTHNDWPLCNGALLPSAQPTAIVEFSHRWIAALATVLVLALAVSAWIWQRRRRRVLAAATVAAVLFVLQIALGALTVKYRLPGGVVMIHLANALLLLGVLVYIAWQSTAGAARREPVAPGRSLERLTTGAAAATYLLALSGALVVERGAGDACAGWPLCGGGWQLPAGQLATINTVHRVVAAIAVVFIATVAFTVWRRRDDIALRCAAALIGVLLVAQVVAGAVAVELQLPAAARALHIALASALWALTVAVAAGVRAPRERVATSPMPQAPHREPRGAPAGVTTL